MNDAVWRYGLAAFVTLLVVVDPPGVVPTFVGLTKGETPASRRRILVRAVLIAFGVAVFFLLAGRYVLSYLGVTVQAFSISGGVLLFLAALPMLFGQRGGLQAPEHEEHEHVGEDISVFPLAIPLLSGPGAIATILLMTSQTGGDMRKLGAAVIAIAAVFIVSFILLNLGARLIAKVGEGGVHIATRVMGIILAALAVQYVLNGITGYYHALWGK
jgi:multiple antibiotic resistance protein